MKKHIITIAGYPGSGKSSTAKGVAKKLGYEHFSSGDLFRKMAAKQGISIEEINVMAEKQKEIDLEVDELLRKLGQEKDELVIDSRMAFHWMPYSFKVFLDLDPEIAARRTFENIQEEGRESQAGSSFEVVMENIMKRRQSERKRYQNLYNVNNTDRFRFDLAVDTEKHNLEEVIDTVINEYNKWIQ